MKYKNCGVKIKGKNIYIALVLTFIFSGLGSIYAGKTDKGIRILAIRIIFLSLGVFVNIFSILAVMVWVYSFYAAYTDVCNANGNSSPDLIGDLGRWHRESRKLPILIVCIIVILAVLGCAGSLMPHGLYSDGSGSAYHGDGGSYSSGGSSHYGGVDDSPDIIAKNDPDWYYDHYEYGDNDKIDEYLESQGYD